MVLEEREFGVRMGQIVLVVVKGRDGEGGTCRGVWIGQGIFFSWYLD